MSRVLAGGLSATAGDAAAAMPITQSATRASSGGAVAARVHSASMTVDGSTRRFTQLAASPFIVSATTASSEVSSSSCAARASLTRLPATCRGGSA